MAMHRMIPHKDPDAWIELAGDRSPGGKPVWRTALRGAIIGCYILVPIYVMLAVYGNGPSGTSGIWGWCPGAVFAGTLAGTLIGSILGGFIGISVRLVAQVFCWLILCIRGEIRTLLAQHHHEKPNL